jgi:hypothetical protein
VPQAPSGILRLHCVPLRMTGNTPFTKAKCRTPSLTLEDDGTRFDRWDSSVACGFLRMTLFYLR